VTSTAPAGNAEWSLVIAASCWRWLSKNDEFDV